MNRIANRALFTLILVLVLAGGVLFFVGEYAAGAEDWIMFPGSPHVYSGSSLSEGMVLDRTGALLMDLDNGRTYAPTVSLRKAVLHWTGDRAGNIRVNLLGTYSGQAVGFDPVNGVYAYGDGVGRIQLTLSAQIQEVALKAMGDYKGTVAVYNYKTGELLCAVSTPTFDPDNVPDIAGDTSGKYEGVYLNRFTQSVYIPGSIFKIVTLAAAMETLPDIREQKFTCTGSYAIGSGDVTCEKVHGKQNLKTAFANSCNCAFAMIVEQVGAEKLQRCVEQFGVVDSVSFDGITTAKGNFEGGSAKGELLAWSGIGQHTDQINPCAFMTFMSAVANGGVGVTPHVVASVESEGKTTYEARTEKRERIMSKATADTLCEYLENNVEVKYGAENFPGLTVCAKTGTGQVGGDRKPNAMFAGFVADSDLPLAFIVAVEDGGYGSKVCIPIIAGILQACRDANI